MRCGVTRAHEHPVASGSEVHVDIVVPYEWPVAINRRIDGRLEQMPAARCPRPPADPCKGAGFSGPRPGCITDTTGCNRGPAGFYRRAASLTPADAGNGPAILDTCPAAAGPSAIPLQQGVNVHHAVSRIPEGPIER